MLDIPGRMREKRGSAGDSSWGSGRGPLVCGDRRGGGCVAVQLADRSYRAIWRTCGRSPSLDPVAPVEPAAKPAYPRFAGHRLRRRGWVLRRVLLLADAVAFLAAVALVDVLRANIGLADPVVLGLRARRLLCLGAVRPGLRPLPERRDSGRAADGGRRAGRDPARHADHVGRRARARRDHDRPAAHGPDRALLGACDRVRAHHQGDRAGSAEPPLRRPRADADRRRRPGRLGDRAETRPSPRIRARGDRVPGRRAALRPAARSRRRPAAARRHLAHRARARGLPRRARDLRVLAASGSRADRALPALHGAGRAGRHRPAGSTR